jgi:tRNA(Ile)-lysidine synthase
LVKINEKSYLSLMLKRFKDFIIEKKLFQAGEKILVGMSGGIDSVVLCHLLHQSAIPFGMAHCNFKLRGEESDQDQEFVSRLSEHLQVPYYLHQFDTKEYASMHGISIQMAARDLRYTWFHKLLDENKYHWIATAHHGNDVLETILLNLSRGTGIAGFHGILPKQGKLIRPLLFLFKEEILRYARASDIHYREDSSNTSNKYHRNLIRNEVVPLLEKINPALKETMKSTAEKVGGVERFFIQKVNEIRNKIVSIQGDVVSINVLPLAEETEAPVILFELLSSYSFSWTDVLHILRSLENIPGKRFFSATHELVKDRDKLVITPLKNIERVEIFIQHTDQFIETPFGNLRQQIVESNNYTISPDPAVASLDLSKLAFPLLLRTWRSGDRFQPLGLKGTKKISDFLIDQKVPLNLKKRTLVLLSGNDIVWLANFRLHELYKVTANTKTVLEIRMMHDYMNKMNDQV